MLMKGRRKGMNAETIIPKITICIFYSIRQLKSMNVVLHFLRRIFNKMMVAIIANDRMKY